MGSTGTYAAPARMIPTILMMCKENEVTPAEALFTLYGEILAFLY